MAIPLNIEDPVVLRRTLEELESSILLVDVAITKVNSIPPTATLAEVVKQINLVSARLNTTIAVINSSLR